MYQALLRSPHPAQNRLYSSDIEFILDPADMFIESLLDFLGVALLVIGSLKVFGFIVRRLLGLGCSGSSTLNKGEEKIDLDLDIAAANSQELVDVVLQL
jgi:hypothetical protein